MTDKELDEMTDRVARALDVPDPSPLFWDHFPERVRAAIGETAARDPAPWWRRRAYALAMSAALVAVLSAWSVWSVRRDAPGGVAAPRPGTAAVTTGDAAPGVLGAASGEDDAGWQVVGSVAESAGIEAVREAGFGVAPGAAEAAVDALSDAERADLVALLRAEMKGDDSGGL